MKKTITFTIMTAIFLLLASSFSAAAVQTDPEQLKGKEIRNERGEKLGTIEDVEMGPGGEVEAVIVEKGGFFGIGGEENRIPWTDLKQGGDSNYLVYIPGGKEDSGYLVDKSEGEIEETEASAEQKQSMDSQKQANLDQEDDQKQAGLDQQTTRQESGQILVKQRGAKVEVDQSEPQVRVKQPEPKVDVQQEPPKVTVKQPAPQIEVKVTQPKPEVTVQQQQPKVDVQQEQPKVAVQQDKPEVKVQQQKPQVTVTKSNPEVQVEKSAQAKVSIEEQQQAQVDIQKQGKPQVEVITVEQQKEQEKKDRQQMAKRQQDQQRKKTAEIEPAEADEWLGKNLVGKNGEKLGTVKMHYLSEDGNSIVYLIIQGDENKMHPVPADLVRIDREGDRLMAEIDKQTLQNSPSFREQENPQLDKQKWSQEIRAYYGEQESGRSRTE